MSIQIVFRENLAVDFRKNCQEPRHPVFISSETLSTRTLQKMTVGGRVGALWIGGLEPYMDEAFLQVLFSKVIIKKG